MANGREWHMEGLINILIHKWQYTSCGFTYKSNKLFTIAQIYRAAKTPLLPGFVGKEGRKRRFACVFVRVCDSVDKVNVGTPCDLPVPGAIRIKVFFSKLSV